MIAGGNIVDETTWCDDADVERALLPAPPKLDELIRVFFTYFNSTWNIFHEPSLREKLQAIRSADRISRFDAFVLFSEP